MKRIAVLTGAGISAESGIRTFRDAGGLWEGYDVQEVASPQGWAKNRELVLDFYNQRRKNVMDAQPNLAHQALAKLETGYQVDIITQNIDDLHERGGSTRVMHLHGEILKARSTLDPSKVYTLDHWEIKPGDKCELRSQLRPHIVWFGEAVPMMEPAIELTIEADIFMVIGTSLEVYPAASLLQFVSPNVPVYIIDPGSPSFSNRAQITFIRDKATTGVAKLVETLLAEV